MYIHFVSKSYKANNHKYYTQYCIYMIPFDYFFTSNFRNLLNNFNYSEKNDTD